MSGTYYVSTSGSDSNNGLTQATAFATLTHAAVVWNALSAANQGNTFIFVSPGTYTEGQIYFNPHINSSGLLTVQCTTPFGAHVNCDPTGNTFGNPLYCFYIWSGGNNGNTSSPYCAVYISGFEVTDRTPGNTALLGLTFATPNCTIDQCYVHDIGNGLVGPGGGDGIDESGIGDGVNPFGAVVQRCKVSHCGPPGGGTAGGHGIYMTSVGAVVQNCLVVGTVSGFGIHFWHFSTQVVCANNTSINNSGGGIIIGNDTNPCLNSRVYNNISMNNGGYGIRTLGGGTGTVDFTDCRNNCLFGNATAPTLFAGAHDTIVATVSSDPLFVLYTGDITGNYHLPLASPCVDAGTNAVGVPSIDLDGNPRPLHGGNWDIGVYEFVPPIAGAPQYIIRVRDHNLIPQGAFAQWTDGDIVLRMNDVGKWALTVRADDPLLQYFAVRGAGIIISCDLQDGRGARTVCSGPVWVITRLGLDNEYTLAGPTDEWWLAAREAMPAGGSPYMEVILDDTPTRYHRLDETSGTAAVDISGNGGNGAYIGAPTLGVAGGVAGDPDTSITLAAASSQRVAITTTGFPTGNGALSFEILLKIAANPVASQYLLAYGNATNTLRQDFNVFLDTTGHLNLDLGNGTGIATSAALGLGVWHHVVAVWDGTVARLFVDNVQTTNTPGVAQAIPVSPSANIGASPATTLFLSGSVDEYAVYAAALSTAQVAAHFASFSATHAGYDARSGVASTVIRAYVNANMVAPTNTYRALPGLALAADPGIGTSVKGNARDENLLTLLQQLALTGGDIGFKLVQTANGVLTFSVYQPVDRSTSIKFSRDLNNLFDYNYSLAGPIANSVLVRGGGLLAGRTAVRAKDAASITAWGLVEGVQDARDTSDVPTMQQRGTATVQASTELTNLAVTPGDNATVRYLVDYQLGDIISMVIDGNTITNKIRSVHIELKNPGDQEKVTPGIGTPTQGDVAHWFDAGQARARALALVQQKLNKLSTVV